MEDANWLNDPSVFEATVEDPNSGTARVVVSYVAGPTLDGAVVEIVNLDGPAVGFGVGQAGDAAWDLGPLRVGDSRVTGVVQRLSSDNAGPPWESGTVTLRIRCKSGRHSREVRATATFPGQAWAY